MSSQSQAGFTITELLITVIIFSLLIPALARMISSLDNINDQARDMATLHALVENKVEGLRSISYAGMTNGGYDFTTELPLTINEPRQAYYVISSVSGTTGLKQIAVTVTYNDHGSTRNFNYTTYLGELGVAQY